MQRDQLDVASRNVDWIETDGTPTQPALCITYHGWGTELRGDFAPSGDGLYPEEEIDVAFRLQSSADADHETGVLSLAHRITGELLLEVTTDVDLLSNFVDAVNRYATTVGTDHSYSIQLRTGSELIVTYEMRTLLVYNSDGTLLRHRSLIPSGIEI
jgi:hypothetical protein